MSILLMIVAIGASAIGAISGIGGGVIIKPIMDAFGVFEISTINFLSGCTVLTMAISSFVKGLNDDVKINYSICVPLSVGASIGGVVGKSLFGNHFGFLSLIQSLLLLLINILVFVYIKNRSHINSLSTINIGYCAIIGFVLGAISSFLGIGGGPINIAVLYYFFSLSPQNTAKNSLFIILFSQLTSLLTTLFTRNIPEFIPAVLALMCTGGVMGAFLGGKISKKLTDEMIEKLFIYVLITLIVLNIYNVILFM